jgi:hypothetical protein
MTDDIKYKIECKKHTKWMFALFLGLFLIILITILSTILYGLINTPSRIGDFAFFVIVMIVFGLIILDRFLWQIKGVELLMITNKIVLIKKGKLFKSTKQIDLNEFESVSFDQDNETAMISKLYGLKGGKIKINYLGHCTRFGQDISFDFAEIISKEIEDKINILRS